MTYIINNALEWANFRECSPLEHSDIIALCSYFKVKIPKRFDMFEYSYNPNHVRSIADTPSSEKIIFNTLSTLKAKILKKFDENKVESRGHKKGVALQLLFVLFKLVSAGIAECCIRINNRSAL